MNIKIIIAAHKPYWMPCDELYLPLHVGKKDKESIGYAGDDTGEQISSKNPYYCELTGLYWAWKNLDSDYIGLAHYRRHFTALPLFFRLAKGKKPSVLTGVQAEQLLKDTDVLLPRKRRYFIETNRSHYAHNHNPEDLQKTEGILRRTSPEYLPSFHKVMNRTSAHMFNMLVMKRDVLDHYCTWMFPLLAELEKEIDLASYNATEARVFGYISEMLLDVWLDKNEVHYKELPVMFMEKQNWAVKIGRFLRRKLSGGPFGKKAK